MSSNVIYIFMISIMMLGIDLAVILVFEFVRIDESVD